MPTGNAVLEMAVEEPFEGETVANFQLANVEAGAAAAAAAAAAAGTEAEAEDETFPMSLLEEGMSTGNTVLEISIPGT